MTKHSTTPRAAWLATIAAAALLTACGREDGDAALSSARDDTVVTADAERSTRRSESATTLGTPMPSQTEQPTAGASTDSSSASATTSAGLPPNHPPVSAGGITGAADAAGSKVEDAAITASVNAELARDPGLSSLAIDVDTNGGQVVLKGRAPDADARERATQLASAVRGVTAVDNRLQISG